ncbi:hypothetical protein MAH1_01460 [Sessilibacter sp. MAH1]
MLNIKKNTVLHKFILESHSDADHKVFKRIEDKYAKAARHKAQAKLQSYIETGLRMKSGKLAKEIHSSEKLGKHLRWDG